MSRLSTNLDLHMVRFEVKILGSQRSRDLTNSGSWISLVSLVSSDNRWQDLLRRAVAVDELRAVFSFF
nr:hypothetical protein Iba_chr04eCG18870 [Ipomoea batatas]